MDREPLLGSPDGLPGPNVLQDHVSLPAHKYPFANT